MNKILVTGGAGYIGSILVPMLLERGYYVRVFDNLMYNGHGLIPHFHNKDFEFFRGDIRNNEDIKKALEDVDIIIHLSAIVGLPACKKDPITSREINVGGTLNIIRNKKPEQLLIFASTISNYGHVEVPGQICNEETNLNPETDYGIQKTEAEGLVRNSDNFIIFRFATAYGMSPRMRIDLLPNDFVYKAVKEKQLIVYEKAFKRPFVHVKDISRGIIFAIENKNRMLNQIFNLGSEKSNVTKEDVANMIKEKFPNFILHFTDVGGQDDRRNFHVDYSKIHSLGFKTEITFEEGIDELIKGIQVIEIINPYTNI